MDTNFDMEVDSDMADSIKLVLSRCFLGLLEGLGVDIRQV